MLHIARFHHACIITVASLALAACAGSAPDQLLAPTGACPAASLASAGSRDLVPGTPLTATNGCAHRAVIDVPLARVIDLNDAGQVLGMRTPTNPADVAIWSRTGTRVLPPPAGSTSATGADINNKGEVVGCAMVPATETASSPSAAFEIATVCHVVLWSAAGIPTDLGLIDPRALEAKGTAINDAGVIIGSVYYPDGTQRAFVRSAAGVVTFPAVPGARSEAVALNEQGEVTGWYTNGSAATGPWRAFVWTASGGVVDLGTVPSRIAGTEPSVKPVAINEAGTVLGTVYGFSPGNPGLVQRSSNFLFARGGPMRDIGPESGLDSAVAINDQNEILGWATVDGVRQPASWATTRPNRLAVRFGVRLDDGALYQINEYNEVLDSFTQGGATRNVVWTYNPERYR